MKGNRVYLYPGRGRGERQYLDQRGTVDDLRRLDLSLSEGQAVGFWADDVNDADEVDDLIFEGTVYFDNESGKWYALIDWESMRHQSNDN